MTTLSEILQVAMQRARIGAQTLSKLTGVPRTSIENWREGIAQRPKHWRPLLQIARVLALSQTEVDTLLDTTGYPSLTILARILPMDHPDREHLRPWLEPRSTTIPRDMAWQLQAMAERTVTAVASSVPMLHQLRAPVTDFVGRKEAIATLIAAHQAVTSDGAAAAISGVHGMGGIGKTELAYRVATQLRSVFPDAQIVIDLRGSRAVPLHAEQALQMAIRAFMPDTRLPDELQMLQLLYRSALHDRRVLILADDAYDAAQVRPLLPPPGCALLVTSRHRFILPGMVPVDLEQLHAEESIALLCSICTHASAQEARAIATACGHLPLALRVSASILHNDPAVPVNDYLSRLMDTRQRLAHLRDPDDDQLDVESSLALSYVLLNTPAQLIFARLGVFAADFSTTLALAVVATPADVDVEATLHLLLRRNLVMYDVPRERWQLHHLVRALALRYLEKCGELESTMWRYARAVVQIAQETKYQYLRGGKNAMAALARFDTERPHIDTARRWATEHEGTREGDMLLIEDAMATSYILDLRYDPQRELVPQLEHALAAARRLGDGRCEALILNSLEIAHWTVGNTVWTIPYYEQRLAITRELDDRIDEAATLSNLGKAYSNLGESRRATSYFEQACTIAHELGDRNIERNALNSLGEAYLELGVTEQAVRYFEQMLACACDLSDHIGEGIALNNLGKAYLSLGNTQSAAEFAERALVITRELGHRYGEGLTLANLGEIAIAEGDAERAITLGKRALAIMREVGDQRQAGYTLATLGRAYALAGELEHASAAFAEALTMLHEVCDRYGMAKCSWHFGLFLIRKGERVYALDLLRAAAAYEQEIGHLAAQEHAALIARLGSGEELG